MGKFTDIDERIPGREEGDDVARLLRQAGKRPAPPPDMVERVRTQVHAVWREELARRRRRRVLAVAASVMTLAFAALWVLQQQGASAPQVVASIERGSAGMSIRGERAAPGATVLVGDRLETGPDAGAVLSLAGDASSTRNLRLAPGTSIAWVAPGQVRLLAGQLYLDAGAAAPGASPAIAFEAAGVRIQHVGTRFLVALSDTHLDVKVRDGTVRVEGAGEVSMLQGGELGRMGLDKTGVTPMQRLPAGSSGEEWSWVDDLAPSLEIDEQSLWSVLQRAAQEGGFEIRFESAAVEQRARETVLHGPALGMPPRQALDAVLVTTAYVAEPDGDGGGLLVRRR
jgi:ferric-dicitrate binding protein FerR (iron transport regulator)